MAANAETFQRNLAWGQAAETAIAQWLLRRGKEAKLDGDGRTFEQIKAERLGVAA